MFSEMKKGDTVLVSVLGRRSSMFESARTFFVPMPVDSHTPKRFAVGGISYKKKDGYSYPYGNGQCQTYDESRDETLQLKEHNTAAAVVSSINDNLCLLGALRVKRGTKNIHTILKQAEILAALIDGGSSK